MKLVETLQRALKSPESPVILVETLSPYTALLSCVQAAAETGKRAICLWDSMGRLRLLVTRENETKWIPFEQGAFMMPVSDRVLELLISRESNCTVMRSYVTEEQEAREMEMLIKLLLSITDAYVSQNKLVVLTADLMLFRDSISRLCITIQHSLPDSDEIRKLLETCGISADSQLIEAMRGLTEDKITNILAEMGGKADPGYFYEKKKEALRLSGLELVEPDVTLDAVGGYRYLKNYIRNRLIRSLRDVDLLTRFGIARDRPRGILLYGLPGTGKTMFATALAAEVGLPMVKLSPSQLFHGIVGESEKAVRRIVKVIEAMAPIIVFIDEADQLLMSRTEVSAGTDSGVSRRVVSALLEWLGSRERKSFAVFATNHVRDIDPAFLRPGRIDAVVPVLLPDEEARREIFRIHTSVVRKIPLIDVDEDYVVKETEMWTGAEIEKMVVSAAWYAIDEGAEGVTMEHVRRAIMTHRVDKTVRRREYDTFLRSLEEIPNLDKELYRQGVIEIYGEASEVAHQLLRRIGHG